MYSYSSVYIGEPGRIVTSGGFAPGTPSYLGGVNGSGGMAAPNGGSGGGGAGWNAPGDCRLTTQKYLCGLSRTGKFLGGQALQG